MKDVSNSSFTILGAGKSGITVAKLLKEHGAQVFLSDSTEKSKLKYFDENDLKKEGIDFETGKHSEKIFDNDAFITSPGISPYSEILLRAKKQRKKIYPEIEAAFWFCKCPVIAITGTNGKTTTTVLTGEIFRNAGYDVKICGNVGIAFSEVVSELKDDSIVVLEVSSFQLEYIDEFRPEIAVLMNITPDHIDWHGSFDNYLKAKLKITKNQSGEDLTIVNYDDDILKKNTESLKSQRSFFSTKENLIKENIERGSFSEDGKIIYFDKAKNIEEEIMKTHEINIRGNHNLYNSLAAIISARALGIRKEIVSDTLKKFQGVEHRIEFVKEINGIKFYNDSKATNIDSLTVALESFDKNLILIIGGRESGNDYSRDDELVKKNVKEIIAIGETKEKISDHFRKYIKVTKVNSMEEAVNKSFDVSSANDTVLLSPACKSFDMFDSFEHRGKEFKKFVNALK
ncbi:MAG: UDP-N-acetylmuramoyl-L-alanine--D-glutamate ligase [Bacteroidota bacterium]|nr:UDP-N-acetylmuramoyl-L-alanine--D-glutamate ligase [Bacteroidota bacterium]